MGGNFNLPLSNKKTARHEFIKVEANVKRNNILNLKTIRNIAIPQFHHFLHEYGKKNALNEQIIDMYNTTVNFCKKNTKILFTRADKGNATVAQDRVFYNNKILDLLNDNNTYSVIKKNPILKIERELNSFLKNWLTKRFISKKEYYFMHLRDSILPKAYGLPKIHKQNIPFRIIVSSINTALYNVAIHFHKILSQSIPTPKSHINNSFELCSILSGKKLKSSDILIS